MLNILMVCLGGAIGSLARYAVTTAIQRPTSLEHPLFPTGTLTANLAGAFIIGLLYPLFDRMPIALEFRLLIFVGLLGGFTTFSSYAIESLLLIRAGELRPALIYIFASNIGGLILAALGFLLMRSALHLLLK
jgi:CrcB protein